MRRLLLGLIVLLILTLVGFALFSPLDPEETNAESEGGQTVTIQQRDVNTTVSSTGILDAERTVYLSFGVSGLVDRIEVGIGDTVSAGQTLVQLDTTDLAYEVETATQELTIQQLTYDELLASPTESEVLVAETALASARSQLLSVQSSQEIAPEQVSASCADVEDALAELEVAQISYDEYVLAGFELDPTFMPDPDSEAGQQVAEAEQKIESAESQCSVTEVNNQDTGQVEIAQANVTKAEIELAVVQAGPSDREIQTADAQLRQAQIRLEQAEASLAAATLTSPFDGVVLDIQALEGESISEAAAVVTLADTSQMQLLIQVDEEDVLKIQPTQIVQIELEAMDDVMLTGEVDRVAPAGSDSQGLVTYDVWIAVDNTIGSSNASGNQTTINERSNSEDANAARADGQTGRGGLSTEIQVLLPVIRELGGVQVVTETLATEAGRSAFLEAVSERDNGDELLSAITDVGGLDAMLEGLSRDGVQASGTGRGTSETPDQNEPRNSDTNTPSNEARPNSSSAGSQTASAPQAVTTVPLRIGMTAEAEIVVETLQNALMVPTTAIQTQGPDQYVLIQEGDADPLQISIETGPTADGMTVIYGDVTANQVVYIPATGDGTQASSGPDPFSLGGGTRPGGRP